MSGTKRRAVAVSVVAGVALTLAGLLTLAPGRARVGEGRGGPLVTNQGPGGGKPSSPATADGAFLLLIGGTPEMPPAFLTRFVTENILPELRRVAGLRSVAGIGRLGYEIRVQLDPDRMRTQNLKTDDVADSFHGCSSGVTAGEVVARTTKADDYGLVHLGHYGDPRFYEEIILRASPEGDIVRLKDVGRVEPPRPIADTALDRDGRPLVILRFEPVAGFDSGKVAAAVTDELRRLPKESFRQGMTWTVLPLGDGTVIGANVRSPETTALEATVARCHDLADQVRQVAGTASVLTLAGYDLRTDRYDPAVGTCLIRPESASPPSLATLRDRCPALAGADVGFFDPPGSRVFPMAGGFSVRVLDRSGGLIPATFLRDLTAAGERDGLIPYLAANFTKYELILDADVAREHDISLAKALAARFRLVGDDDPGGGTPRRLVEDFAYPNYLTDLGEAVPYRSFLQLRLRPDQDAIHGPD